MNLFQSDLPSTPTLSIIAALLSPILQDQALPDAKSDVVYVIPIKGLQLTFSLVF